MAEPNDGGPAFPRVLPDVKVPPDRAAEMINEYAGMSLRVWFAGLAMAHVSENLRESRRFAKGYDRPWSQWTAAEAAAACYEMADAMIAERDKPTRKDE